MKANVTLDLNVLESMIYFWEASKDGEKVGEQYIMTIAEDANMKSVYTEDFNDESVRRALSAISNREIFDGSKIERKFWNNNMWMMDDLDFMREMIKPVKTLNISSLIENIDSNVEELEVVVLPLHTETHYIVDNKLILNFFSIRLDFMDYSIVTFDNMPLADFIQKALQEVASK
ncbi:hypothetical protein IMX26_03840 [Clostridium sp. 'deep sea']|uniref:TDE2712 family protein n=1 Tax=Clostridium sp. 'deep sea' TaxID=2779445 RepID=UPI0018968B48|nr:hypothetical protein [Clostridium sp. 'deep sea']QOR35963.1 hypothetical protein IMX26_03840 [Clostridium sp. 'deep sea']